MNRRLFVDSDIILDLLLKRQPFFPPTVRLFLLVQDGDVKGYTSPLVFSNLAYVLRKHISPEEVRPALSKLRALLRVIPIDDKILDMALASSFKDFEDAIQYHAALAFGVDAILTRNKKDYKTSTLPIFSAKEYVASYDAEIKKNA
jgi:predicted nucleic acid-binding protein